MNQSFPKHCVVITCFSENQPGFLDFSYRIHSLAKYYQLTIVSQDRLTQVELMIDGAEYVEMGRKSGKIGWLTYLFKCAGYIRKQSPDVVMLLHSGASLISLMVGKIPTCLYWNEHPTNLIQVSKNFSSIRNFIALTSHKLVFLGAKLSDLVMPIGEDHYNDLIQNHVDAKKIVMIYMGVSDQFQLNQKIKKHEANQRINLIYIGTISKLRGRDVMLEAMAILAKKNISAHLTMVGANQEQLDFCKKRIQELRIADTVTVLGRVVGNKIPEYLAQADFGICLWEQNIWNEFNPPTKLFEYLVAGLPVLASNIRTHTRYVQEWENGLIFDYNANSLASVISDLDKNKNKIKKLKMYAKLSSQQYLWSKLEPLFLDSMRMLVLK
jgi:glycosyltransferase involved in cell wall biosynthesis